MGLNTEALIIYSCIISNLGMIQRVAASACPRAAIGAAFVDWEIPSFLHVVSLPP